MNILNMIVLAILPGIIIFAFIYLQDKYDKEPFKLLVKVFVFGMIAVIPTLIAETIGNYFNVFNGLFGIFIEAFIVVALTEEFFKRQVVKRHAYNHPAFNELLDGVVYCVVASLGFATLENISYVINYYASDPTIWMTRAILSVPTHALLGITMGYYLALSKFSIDSVLKKKFYRKSLVIPVILHGIYDFILMSEIQLLYLLFYPFVIYLWVVNIKKLRKYQKLSKLNHQNRQN